MKHRGSSTLLKALPLKLQQTAFENAYLKALEGMREVVILAMHKCSYHILLIIMSSVTLPVWPRAVCIHQFTKTTVRLN